QLPRGTLLWTAAAPLPLLLLSLDGELSRLDGAILVAWFGVALFGLVRAGRELIEPATPDDGQSRGSVARRVVLPLVGGSVLLVAGGDALARGIRQVVSHVGIPQTLLGNIVVAAAVEGEEIARVVIPARRGRPEVGLANVLGTIVHFVALNAGVIALVRPLPLGHETLAVHLPAAVAATLVLCALASRGLGRLQGGVLVVLYLAYLAVAISV